ncbi:MAG TPA: hypothetical protein DD730_10035 [Desulfosporosinus sp.]|nr:hypothetical protein [Desulfosporosinus sp.]
MQSIADCQFVCRRDIQEGGRTWCKLWIKDGGEANEIDLNGKVSTSEATSFNMIVGENSPLKEHFEMPIDQCAYDTFVGARAILIQGLPVGQHRVHRRIRKRRL